MMGMLESIPQQPTNQSERNANYVSSSSWKRRKISMYELLFSADTYLARRLLSLIFTNQSQNINKHIDNVIVE